MSTPIRRQDLLDVPVEPARPVSRVRAVRVELAPGQAAGRHDHPGPVAGTVLAGTIQFEIEDGPARTLTAGDAFFEPAGTVIARFDNACAREPASFVAIYLLTSPDQDLIRPLGEQGEQR